jgi:stage II sporulation protein AA (anti-sigma F factor antagonist)
MTVKESLEKGVMYIKLIGEMDEYSSAEVRAKCDKLIEKNLSATKIIFNLSEVAFMDSTGIGFLIGRYKKAARMGIPVYVQKPNLAADKILNLSGIYSLIPKAD